MRYPTGGPLCGPDGNQQDAVLHRPGSDTVSRSAPAAIVSP
jgi:hypothetical protein